MSNIIVCSSCGNKSSVIRFLKNGGVHSAEHEKPCIICGANDWQTIPLRVLHLTLKKRER